MDPELIIYRDRFDDIQLSLKAEVCNGMDLIEELLRELDNTKTTLKQTKFDLENECEARRRLQQEVQDGRELIERQGRWPFIVALIDADADCYVFHDHFITRGEKGGEDAADALMVALQQFVRSLTGESNGIDIVVRAFANMKGLGAALQRDGRLKDRDQLKSFATGFSSRQALFDFVDIGPGKERADLKVRENIKFFLDSFQCKHLVLACGHDDGYAPWLGQFVGDKQVMERITLLEGSPFTEKMRNLGLKSTRFSSVFNNISPVRGRVDSPTTTETTTTTVDSSNKAGKPTTIRSTESGIVTLRNPHAQVDRLGPLLKDESGHRIDRPLKLNKAAMGRIKKGHLCYYFYLRGQCTGVCPRNHFHRPLTDDEFDVLWDQARQGKCHKTQKAEQKGSNECSDVLCFYGHREGGK